MTFNEVLSAAGVTILPVNQRCGPGQTHAAGVLKSIFRQHGAEHLATVLSCIATAPGNELWSETIGAVSDCLARRPEWPHSAFVAAFRTIDLDHHRRWSVRLRPWRVRGTLRISIDIELTELEKAAA